VWGGSVPLPTGDGSGEGLCPFPEIFPFFVLKMASFGAFWELILLHLMSYTHKPVSLDFGL